MYKLCLLFIFLSLFPSAWGDSAKDNPIELSQAIQPRTEGAAWIYKSVFYEDGEATISSSTIEEVIATKEIDGITCYHIRLTFEWRTLTQRLGGVQLEEDAYDYFWEYFNDKGSFNFDDEASENLSAPSTLKAFDLTLPFPTKKGHTYQFDTDQYKIVDVDVEIEVPLGKYKCTVYEIVDPDPEYPTREYFYMSPGVGLVRYDYEIKDVSTGSDWYLDNRDELVWCNLPTN